MAVNLTAPDKDKLLKVAGIKLGVARAGIKAAGQADLTLVALAHGTVTSTAYTQNAFCAAPILVARQHEKQTAPRYLLINAGNANAGTGEEGIQSALDCCQFVAHLTGSVASSVLPFSTGVIGEKLPVLLIKKALPVAYQNLADDNWLAAAHAMMTTDTTAKAISHELTLDGKTITITGIAKGSGMICPNMATMLAFIATDANVEQAVLDSLLKEALTQSFNRITVDGDTSTNDACVLMATAQAGNQTIVDSGSKHARKLAKALISVSQKLAQAVIRDGEGATKFIAINVLQGKHSEECREVAYTIAHSPLVKTAFFASDPNWGRILAAVGRSRLANLDLSAVSIYLDDVCIIERGQPAITYSEQQGQKVMAQDEITITVQLGRGRAQDTVWTCDFSYDYVKINAEYRS